MSFADLNIYIPHNASGNIRTTCPQCSKDRRKTNDKCLSVNVDDSTFFCHHCSWAGSARTKNDYPQSTKKVYTKPAPPKTDLTDEFYAFFQKRGISREVLKRNRVALEKTFMPNEGKEVLAIAFPFYEGGEIVNIKYRDLNKNFKQVTNAKKVFYGIDDVTECEMIVVEGEMDKLALEMAGYISVVSVPDGAPPANAKSYETKFDFIGENQKVIDRLKKIIIAVDNDGPGQKLEEELVRRFGPERCWRVTWSEGCKDANDVLVKHGVNDLALNIETAKPVPVSGIFEINDISKDIDELYENGMQGGADTGWRSVSNYYTVRPGEWSVVTGVPSHGKSEFVDALIVNLSLQHDWRFAIFSPENQPLQRHAAKIAQKFIGQPFGEGVHRRMDRDLKDIAKYWMQDRFFFILPPDDEITIDHILKKAEITVKRYGIRGLVIDPWNELDHSRPAGLSETEYISLSLTKIRRFARTYQVHVWVVAHPVKLQKEINGNYPVPSPYDISGSAHWRNKADCAIAIWRDVKEEDPMVQVHIQKVRFREVGRVGMAELTYDTITGRYSDKSFDA